MKPITKLATAILTAMQIAAGCGTATAQDTKQVRYGYMNPDAELQLTTSVGRVTYHAYISLPATYATMYDGCEITAVDVAIGSCRKAPNTNFKINITDDYRQNTDYLYQQAAEVTPGTVNEARWNHIDLDTPYRIEGGKQIYIGYQLDASTGHAPVASSTAYPAKTGTNDLVGYAVSDGSYSMQSTGAVNAIILTIKGDNVPASEIEIARAKVDRYGYHGYDTMVECMVKNNGADDIDGIDYSYMLRYGAQDHEAVSGTVDCPTPTGCFGKFDIAIPVTDDMKGTVTVNLTATPRGGADHDPANNTWKTTFTIAADCVPRVTLIEGILSTADASTDIQYKRVEQTLSMIGADNAVVVNHYHDAGTLNSDMIADFNVFYAHQGIQFPAVQIDRTIAYEDYGITPFYPYEETPGLAKDIHEITTPVKVELLNPRYDGTTGALLIDLKAETLKALDAPVYANVVITEDNVNGRQYGSADINNFNHRHVYRAAAVPTVQGDPISLDQPLEKTYQIQVPEYCDLTQLTAVAYINHHNARKLDQCQVLNATSLKLELDPSGIQAVGADNAGIRVSGRTVHCDTEAAVYTIDGRLAATGRTATLQPGAYIIKAGGKTQKTIIK